MSRIASVALVIAAFVAACAPNLASAPPGSIPAPSEAASPPAPSAPAATAAADVPVLGCLDIEQAECESVARIVLDQLLDTRGVPFSIQIELYGCSANDDCPASLSDRQGMITVEYADGGAPISRTVSGPPERPTFGDTQVTYSGLIEPESPRVTGLGPFDFTTGHCGMAWKVDFDGSFWLPIGQIDTSAGDMINSEAGQMRLLNANVAEFRTPAGFVAQLARFPGPKHVWLCD